MDLAALSYGVFPALIGVRGMRRGTDQASKTWKDNSLSVFVNYTNLKFEIRVKKGHKNAHLHAIMRPR